MDQPIQDVSTREGYDRWASGYDSYDNPLIALEEPVVRELIREPAGLTAIDVGCGTGRHTAWLAERGARVTGVDFSQGMLEVLRAKVGARPIELIEHDLGTGIPAEDSRFDLAISCLVLEHVDDLAAIFAELSRVVRPGGRVVISDFHPEMVRRGFHARFREAPGQQKIQIRGASHTISDYVMAAVGAGLRIDHMSEHIMTEALAEQSRSAKKWVGEPLLLALELSRSA
jgi:malonyl-CoA O-methyltransferase